MTRTVPRGVVVVVAGPDGSGKSAVADALTRRLPAPVLHYHHRPRLLPGRAGTAVDDPHRSPPYSALVTRVKVLYLFADWLLGWVLRVRPVRRSGGTVVIERGWWDLLVDPRRYRLAGGAELVRFLGRRLPRPDVTVVLSAPPATLLARKTELPADELQRQLACWEALLSELPGAHGLDAGEPLEQVIEAARRLLVPPLG